MDWLPTRFKYLSLKSRVNLLDFLAERCVSCGSLSDYVGYCTNCNIYEPEYRATYEEICAILVNRNQHFFELRFSEISDTELEIGSKPPNRRRMLVMVFDESGERQSRLGGYRYLPYTVSIDDDTPNEEELIGIGIPIDIKDGFDHSLFRIRQGIVDDTYILADKTRPLTNRKAADHGIYEGYIVSSSNYSKCYEVAVKIDMRFRDQTASHTDSGLRTLHQMKEEFSLVQRAGSPYVVKYLNLALDGPVARGEPCTAYLAMELCQRKTLGDIMQDLEPHQIKVIAMQLLLGLSHLHSNDILHRDLTPENVFISRSGKRIKIGDFDHVKELKQGMSHVSNESTSKSRQLEKYFQFHTYLQKWKDKQTRQNNPNPFGGLKLKYRSVDDVFSAAVIICCCLFKNENCNSKWGNRKHTRSGVSWIGIDLIEMMIEHKCSAEDALLHPYFWNTGKRFDFFEQLKSYFLPFAKGKCSPDTDIENYLFDTIKEDLKFNWISFVLEKTMKGPRRTEILKDAVESRRASKYDPEDIFDFIRFVRNTKIHRNENETKDLFNSDEELWSFFETSTNFSEIFLGLWKIIKASWIALAECPQFPSDMRYFFSNDTTPLLDLLEE